MDSMKIGQLILQLRTEKGLTQQQLADRLQVSNKAVSKWETGNGVPDSSLWTELSTVLGADLSKLLQGEPRPNRPDVGRMDRTRFYVCPFCGNILTSTGAAVISCCGRSLAPLTPKSCDEAPGISVAEIDLDYYVELRHEMRKDHYISFAAYVQDSFFWFQRLYPEQSPAFRMPVMRANGTL